MKKVGVIGAGSFGLALAITLASKGHEVTLYGRNQQAMAQLAETRISPQYLPVAPLPKSVQVTSSLAEGVQGKEALVFAVPAQSFRQTALAAAPYMQEGALVVDVAKGIEENSLLRLSEVAQEVLPAAQYASLSGPSHAEEVGRGMPTTVAVAAEDPQVAIQAQDLFFTDRFRVYTASDLVGVELGGALKNIIALGAGISDGIGYGDNARAALMTRGIVEITRLGVAMGAKEETFAGLTGIGDLIVTCTSMHSRNHRCGILIGQGMDPAEAVKRVGMVVEGITTTRAAYQLAQKMKVEMPITQQIYQVLQGTITPEEAVNTLMTRQRKAE